MLAGYYIHHKRNEQQWPFWVLASSSELVSDVGNIQRIGTGYRQYYSHFKISNGRRIHVMGKEKETARTSRRHLRTIYWITFREQRRAQYR